MTDAVRDLISAAEIAEEHMHTIHFVLGKSSDPNAASCSAADGLKRAREAVLAAEPKPEAPADEEVARD